MVLGFLFPFSFSLFSFAWYKLACACALLLVKFQNASIFVNQNSGEISSEISFPFLMRFCRRDFEMLDLRFLILRFGFKSHFFEVNVPNQVCCRP